MPYIQVIRKPELRNPIPHLNPTETN